MAKLEKPGVESSVFEIWIRIVGYTTVFVCFIGSVVGGSKPIVVFVFRCVVCIHNDLCVFYRWVSPCRGKKWPFIVDFLYFFDGRALDLYSMVDSFIEFHVDIDSVLFGIPYRRIRVFYTGTHFHIVFTV
jgi:hypothetical protein